VAILTRVPVLTETARAAISEVLWREVSADPLRFLAITKTLDEHVTGEPAIRPFPLCGVCGVDEDANERTRLDEAGRAVCLPHRRRHKPYIRVVSRAWQDNEILNLEKSRQVVLSWTMVGLHVWLALTRPGSLIGFQSENFPKAVELLNRAALMYDTLPEALRRWGPLSDAPKARARKIEDRIEFPEMRSRIIALPCGPNQVRMFTWTALFMDEVQHWEPDEDFEESYTSALAAIKGGGRLTAVSTVKHPNRYHYRLCHGLV